MAVDKKKHEIEPSDHDSSVKDESDYSDTSLVRSINEDEFPSTTTVLTSNNGSKVYLVGTAHFSEVSQEDVSKVIQKVKPHIVMVELCSQRTNILQLDEKKILEEAKNINFAKIKTIVKENGLFNSLVYISLLNMSAYITKQLGIAPGGEFRRAIQEARKIPNCIIHLGDRPIQITMHRAISVLSWWQTVKLVWRLLMTRDPFDKDEIERCKEQGLLRQMMAEMENEFPALKKVLLEERDLYLTYSLQIAANNKALNGPTRVVGIVGIGHVQGILDNWGKVTTKNIRPILKMPPTSKSSRILKVSFKFTAIGILLYTTYKIIPKRWF